MQKLKEIARRFELLEESPIVCRITSIRPGLHAVQLSGGTYNHRDTLKSMDFKYDAGKRTWQFLSLSDENAFAKANEAKRLLRSAGARIIMEQYEDHSATNETKLRRFYDGIVAQETINIGDVAVPVIKDLAKYVRLSKQYGKNGYIMNKEFETPDNSGVIFFDDENKKIVAYSPPQWFFSGTAQYTA